MSKKHPQFILALDSNFFDGARHHFPKDGINRVSMEDVLSWPQTASALVLRERQWLETDSRYRQLLPYLVVRQLDEFHNVRFFVYQRMQGVGEQRLAGKMSLGFGGHIDMDDVQREAKNRSVIDLPRTIMRAALREMSEELEVNGERADSSVFAMNLSYANQLIVSNGGVDAYHVGIIMYVDLPAGMEVKCREEELRDIGMYRPSEMDGLELESWSRLFIEGFAS